MLLLWLALMAGRVAGEPLRLTLWADCLPLDRAGLRAPSRCTTESTRLKSPMDSTFPCMKEGTQVTLISALPAVAATLLS